MTDLLMRLRFLLYAMGCAAMGQRELAEIHFEIYSGKLDKERALLERKKDALKGELGLICHKLQPRDPAFHAAMLSEVLLYVH